MADWGQIEESDGVREAERPAACQVCEAMLPDAVDGTLSEAEQRAFERHVAGCVVCARELEEARRGAAWLGLLKQQAPEPGAMLLERILAQTTGVPAAGAQASEVQVAGEMVAPVAATPPLWAPASLSAYVPEVPREAMLPKGRSKARAASAWQAITGALSLEWMRPMLQPRMAMTAAMAFFSIALTLNLTGVRLSSLSVASLRPSALRRTVADRSAEAVRSFQNMRVVYQAEAQVSDLRNSWQAQEEQPAPETRREGASEPTQPKQAPENQPDQQPKQENRQGSSRLDLIPMGVPDPGITRKGA